MWYKPFLPGIKPSIVLKPTVNYMVRVEVLVLLKEDTKSNIIRKQELGYRISVCVKVEPIGSHSFTIIVKSVPALTGQVRRFSSRSKPNGIRVYTPTGICSLFYGGSQALRVKNILVTQHYFFLLFFLGALKPWRNKLCFGIKNTLSYYSIVVQMYFPSKT